MQTSIESLNYQYFQQVSVPRCQLEYLLKLPTPAIPACQPHALPVLLPLTFPPHDKTSQINIYVCVDKSQLIDTIIPPKTSRTFIMIHRPGTIAGPLLFIISDAVKIKIALRLLARTNGLFAWTSCATMPNEPQLEVTKPPASGICHPLTSIRERKKRTRFQPPFMSTPHIHGHQFILL